MSVNAVDIIIYLAIFVVAFGLSMMLLREIAKVLFKEFSGRFDQQIDLYKTHRDKALRAHLNNVDSMFHFKDEIIKSFESMHEEIGMLQKQLKSLNELCQNREELESEILKLKSILKRKEKKQ